jgi:hypothetical protein
MRRLVAVLLAPLLIWAAGCGSTPTAATPGGMPAQGPMVGENNTAPARENAKARTGAPQTSADHGPLPTPKPPPADFTIRRATKTGLVAISYPPQFGAKALDGSTLFVEHPLGGLDDEGVVIAGLVNPRTDDVDEFARLLVQAKIDHVTSEGGTYAETGRKYTTCYAGLEGLRIDSTVTFQSGRVLVLSTCYWMYNGHAYEAGSLVSSGRAAEELPLLNRILGTLEMLEPSP